MVSNWHRNSASFDAVCLLLSAKMQSSGFPYIRSKFFCDFFQTHEYYKVLTRERCYATCKAFEVRRLPTV
jgi:hypothetical protein